MELTGTFHGSLADVSVPTVLHRIVEVRARGTLTLSRPGETIHLFFVDGELKTAATTRRGMRIGEALLLHGLVEEDQIEGALRSIHAGRHPRIGRTLVEKGLLSREVLDAEIRRHFEEIFYSAFAWKSGDFAFAPETGRLDPDVALDLPTAALIMEGVRRTPVDRRLDELGDPAHFVRATKLAERVESLQLNSGEAYLLSLCDGKTRLRDLLRLGGSREDAAQTLYTLLAAGLIALSPELPPGPPHEPWDTSPLLLPIDLSGAHGRPDDAVRQRQARIAYLEANACLERDDRYGAVVLLQDCIRIAPENSEYHFRLAGALAFNRLWRQRALDQYREAFRLDPLREELMIEFGELLFVCREYGEAREIARSLADRYPSKRNRELLSRCEGALDQSGGATGFEASGSAGTPTRH